MLDKLSLLSYLRDDDRYIEFSRGEVARVSSPESLALLSALSFAERPRKLCIILPSISEAHDLTSFINNLIPEDQCFLFSYDEIFRTSAIGVSREMHDERMLALASVYEDEPSIIVTHTSALALLMTPPDVYEGSLIRLRTGELIDHDELMRRIEHLGYTPTDRVTAPGQFAIRGEILDIYDPAHPDPIRAEFFGDEVDDLRLFKVLDELSYQHVSEITIHPFSSSLFSKEQYESGKREMIDALDGAEVVDRNNFDGLKEKITRVMTDSSAGYLDDIDRRFYPFFNREETTLIDYLDDYEIITYHDDMIRDEFTRIKDKEKSYFKKAIKDNNSLVGERVYVDSLPEISSYLRTDDTRDPLIVRPPSYRAISYAESDRLFRRYLDDGYKVRVILPEPNLTNCENHLSRNEIPYTIYPKHSDIMFLEGTISSGFELPESRHVYLSAREIYGISDTRSRFLTRYKDAKIIRKYEDLKVGDYVVHEVHGVGRYLGVTTMDGLEYLKIQYADDAIFYLPLSQYRLIRKYSSREGFKPALDKIGGSTWSRKRSKIRAKISYLADQLLAIYAERKTMKGFSFPSFPELEREYLDSFPYQYTSSQLEAIGDVKKDMESDHPMDRLIAGDVGYGKTEIAFYAVFKAALAGKQSVLLCPTTILAQQHLKVAKQRLEPFGIRIVSLSRFVSKKEQDAYIREIAEGEVDLIIGTHRVLSDDIKFKDLGLLVIDEEQRFGVAHKEKIKEKAKSIDCLTLTATPIPRTLQMSLLNVRSLSLLEEPPVNRLPVKTYVAKMDRELIYEVIEKELDRKGQVYYLVNRIKSLNPTAERLKKKFPHSTIGIVHAKMDSDEIEQTMNRFYAAEIDILVCTSIIESGLDIPNVNTIIVEDADHFGLAQLYQIRGRVGRSDRLAYAYFFFKSEGKLTDEAKKRLKALKDFAELGSGYKIAMQDLNIRGAGDILGSEQAGFVDTLGYDAYNELLDEVMREKKTVTEALSDRADDERFELSFSLDAHIPSQYGNESERISMYRELSDCDSEEKISAFAEKLRDVYGPYQQEVANLLVKRNIEVLLNSDMVDGFVEGLGVYTITMSRTFSSIPYLYKDIDEALSELKVKLRVKIVQDRFEFILTKTNEYLSDLLFLLRELRSLADKKRG